MLLSDIFDQLTAGELSQLSIGGINTRVGIDECDYPKVIPHVNLALTELYKRFPINLEEVDILQIEGQNVYTLDPKYAVTNTASFETKYIIDSAGKPFTKQPLRIETIFNEAGEETRYTEEDIHTQELERTDRQKYWMVYTPKYNQIYLPYPEAGKLVHVTYRSAPDKIEVLNLNPYAVDIDIPVSLLEPLLYFIAARVYSNLDSDGTMTEGNVYMQKFEAACQRVHRDNLLNIYDHVNDKLDVNNWV